MSLYNLEENLFTERQASEVSDLCYFKQKEQYLIGNASIIQYKAQYFLQVRAESTLTVNIPIIFLGLYLNVASVKQNKK